jgi:hypothetical protein
MTWGNGRIRGPGAISRSKYCGYPLCGRGEGAGAFPRRYTLGPLGRATLYPYNRLLFIGLRNVWVLQNNIDIIQMGTYAGIL